VTDANRHHEWPQMFFVTVLRFRHLGHHILKPDDCDIFVNEVLHFVQSAGIAQKISNGKTHRYLPYCTLLSANKKCMHK